MYFTLLINSIIHSNFNTFFLVLTNQLTLRKKETETKF